MRVLSFLVLSLALLPAVSLAQSAPPEFSFTVTGTPPAKPTEAFTGKLDLKTGKFALTALYLEVTVTILRWRKPETLVESLPVTYEEGRPTLIQAEVASYRLATGATVTKTIDPRVDSIKIEYVSPLTGEKKTYWPHRLPKPGTTQNKDR